MKRIALALIACAGLGLAARQSVLPTASQCSVAGPAIILSEGPPVETPLANDNTTNVIVPLVEKMLPKPATVKQSLTVQDGQLSPRGEWRWSQAQWAWVPVKQAGPRWVQDGHSATIDHLVREHGYSRASLERLTQSQLDVLHSNAHNAARATATVRSSCPSGNCPNTNMRAGIFGRRR